MGGTPETGEGRSDGRKTSAAIPREWERVEGDTRPLEWKTPRGETQVVGWLERSS